MARPARIFWRSSAWTCASASTATITGRALEDRFFLTAAPHRIFAGAGNDELFAYTLDFEAHGGQGQDLLGDGLCPTLMPDFVLDLTAAQQLSVGGQARVVDGFDRVWLQLNGGNATVTGGDFFDMVMAEAGHLVVDGGGAANQRCAAGIMLRPAIRPRSMAGRAMTCSRWNMPRAGSMAMRATTDLCQSPPGQAHVLYGDAGNDGILQLGTAGEIYGGEGDDWIQVNGTSQGAILDGGAGIEQADPERRRRTQHGLAGQLFGLDRDLCQGWRGLWPLYRLRGDFLSGGMLADSLRGGSGADTLTGDSLDERYTSEGGRDTLMGGRAMTSSRAWGARIRSRAARAMTASCDRCARRDVMTGGLGRDASSTVGAGQPDGPCRPDHRFHPGGRCAGLLGHWARCGHPCRPRDAALHRQRDILHGAGLEQPSRPRARPICAPIWMATRWRMWNLDGSADDHGGDLIL